MAQDIGFSRYPMKFLFRCALDLPTLVRVLFLAQLFSGIIQADAAQKLTFVIVHGAFGGGWDWKEVDEALSKHGHKVYRPTLTGLGERAHLTNAPINLSSHIQVVINIFYFEKLTNVVLCGHSYGGMVLTGVMEKVPDRMKRVIFLDAFIPEDGESVITYAKAMGETWDAKETAVSAAQGFWAPSWLKFGSPAPSEEFRIPGRRSNSP